MIRRDMVGLTLRLLVCLPCPFTVKCVPCRGRTSGVYPKIPAIQRVPEPLEALATAVQPGVAIASQPINRRWAYIAAIDR
ncbi:hypothetical protein F4861DRAFT_501324 [Xylaria intraflava]|nr:hypothetical protein F4861DRAFT_501324 [Xylaria intraflava]